MVLSWSKLVQICPFWSNRVQIVGIGIHLYKFVQTCTNWSKLVEIGFLFFSNLGHILINISLFYRMASVVLTSAISYPSSLYLQSLRWGWPWPYPMLLPTGSYPFQQRTLKPWCLSSAEFILLCFSSWPSVLSLFFN